MESNPIISNLEIKSKLSLILSVMVKKQITIEKTIKNELADCIWYVDDRKTEWLDKKYDETFLENFVSKTIEEKHCKLKIIHRNYNFTLDHLVTHFGLGAKRYNKLE